MEGLECRFEESPEVRLFLNHYWRPPLNLNRWQNRLYQNSHKTHRSLCHNPFPWPVASGPVSPSKEFKRDSITNTCKIKRMKLIDRTCRAKKHVKTESKETHKIKMSVMKLLWSCAWAGMKCRRKVKCLQPRKSIAEES